MTTDSVPDPQISKMDGRVLISLDETETDALLLWLDRIDTGWLSDPQYLYFIKFKRQLSLMNSVSSNVEIIPVAVPSVEEWGVHNRAWHEKDNPADHPRCKICNPPVAEETSGD